MLKNTFSLNSDYGRSSVENSKNQVFYLVLYTPPGLHEHMNYLVADSVYYHPCDLMEDKFMTASTTTVTKAIILISL